MKRAVFSGNWRHGNPSDRDWLLLSFIVLGTAYLPTFAYPYLLLDEAWLVLEGTYKWTYHLGRPLFTVIAWLTAKLSSYVGLDVIYAMRLFAVVFIALACLYLMKWLRTWGHGEVESAALAIAAMTLPAFQIVVADGTQLAAGIFLAIFATYQFHVFPWASQRLRYGATSALLLGALLIYQQQILIALAMLCVPLLRGAPERKTYKLVIGYSVLIAGVCVLYFIVWKATYQRLLGGRIDVRYGPDAVGLPTLELLGAFFDSRLSQVANLWSVDPPQWSWIAITVAVLGLVKILRDSRFSLPHAALKFLMALGLLVGTDSIAIAARNYPSYVTATALSLAVFYWAYSGAALLLKKYSTHGAVLLAVVGCICAFTTVKDQLALPNWAEMQRMRNTLISHSEATSFHFIGEKRGGPKFQEFSWRNSVTDGYILYAVEATANDLVLRGEMSAQRRKSLHLSVEGVGIWSTPEHKRSQPRIDAISVPLN